jgi:hypothetical protein
MSENPILMTQAEYARHRNKSPQYIGKLYKAGILVMRGRLVDVAASDAVLDDKPSEKTTMDGQAPASHAQARLADMVRLDRSAARPVSLFRNCRRCSHGQVRRRRIPGLRGNLGTGRRLILQAASTPHNLHRDLMSG